MQRIVVWVASGLIGIALGAAPAAAQQSKCLSGKLKSAGSAAAAQTNCEAKAAAKGVAVDPDCVAKAAAKLQGAFGKAENKDDCIQTGDDAAAQAVVDDFVAELKNTLNPPPLVCCQVTGACFYEADAAGCTTIPGGTAGADGSVCTGDGTCAAPPAAAGNCCQDVSGPGFSLDCINGTFTASDCTGAGGTFSTAICTKSGKCL